jgi:hypothetical protein
MLTSWAISPAGEDSEYPLNVLLSEHKRQFECGFNKMVSNWLIPCSRLLLVKLKTASPVKRLPVFHGTRSSLSYSKQPTTDYNEPN